MAVHVRPMGIPVRLAMEKRADLVGKERTLGYFDFLDQRAADWQIANVAQVGGADVFGAGAWLFLLKSESVRVELNYALMSIGVGGGGWYSLSGLSAPSSDRWDP